jgi:hypothetical protein
MTVEMCGAGGESMEWVSENDGILVTYRQAGGIRLAPATDPPGQNGMAVRGVLLTSQVYSGCVPTQMRRAPRAR